jgi:hypothetical protein
MKKYILLGVSLLVLFSSGLPGQGIYIQPGARVTVSGGGKLIAAGGSAGQMVFKTDATGSGSLVVDNDPNSAVILSGDARVDCFLTPDTWHFISSPISDGLSGIFLNDYLITSNPSSSNGWGPYIVPVNVPLEVMRGYTVWKPASNPSSEQFAGSLNNGEVSRNINRNASDPWAGWHMVGNPYPCAIDLASPGISWGQVEPTAYFWNQNSGNYYSYPHLASPPINVGGDHSQYVPSMQGFYVHVSSSFSGTTSLTIDNSARLHDPEPFLKSTEAAEGFLVLKVTGTKNTFYDKAVIHFNSDANPGYDPGYDGYKLFGEEDAPQLYSQIEGADLSYNSLPYAGAVTVVPLGFKCGLPGKYTITALNIDGFASLSHVILEDKKENRFQELLVNQVYTFNYETGEREDRFLIRFQNPSIGIGPNSGNGAIRIWTYEDYVYVQNNDAATQPEQLFVYDLLGRERYHSELTVNSLDKVRMNLNSGYYVVKVIAKDEVLTQKVYLQ